MAKMIGKIVRNSLPFRRRIAKIKNALTPSNKNPLIAQRTNNPIVDLICIRLRERATIDSVIMKKVVDENTAQYSAESGLSPGTIDAALIPMTRIVVTGESITRFANSRRFSCVDVLIAPAPTLVPPIRQKV